MSQASENGDRLVEEEKNEQEAGGKPRVRVLSFAALVVIVLVGAGLGTRYYLQQNLSIIHTTLSVFFSINMLICYWEACLFLRRTRIEKRTVYWRNRRIETGRLPHVEFFSSKIPWTQVFSPSIWADVWATYAQYDPSFADRRTFGFNVDISNGFFTLIPTLLLYAAITVYFLPAYVVGMIGLILSWQWTYMTSVYFVSFFVAKRHAKLSRGDLYLYIFATNSPWVLIPLLGLYVSIRLIVDGNFSVLA